MTFGAPLVNPAPQVYYSTSPQAIPTPDGSGEATEPAARFVPGGWNGYRWWMAFSPLTVATGVSTENPSVIASNDGQSWVAPATNPIIAQRATGNNADAYLFLDPTVTATAYLVYQVEHDPTPANNGKFGCSSTDGVTWTAPVKLYSPSGNPDEPKLVYDRSSSLWRLYWTDSTSGQMSFVTASTPLATSWSSATVCSLPGYSTPWHWDILCEPNGRWIAGLYAPSASGMYLASSWDGINWTVASRPVLTTGHAGSWAANGVYRPNLVRVAKGYYGLYYSGLDATNKWRIGYCTIPANEVPLG